MMDKLCLIKFYLMVNVLMWKQDGINQVKLSALLYGWIQWPSKCNKFEI